MKKNLLFILLVFMTAFASAQDVGENAIFSILPPSAFEGTYPYVPMSASDPGWPNVPDPNDPANAVIGFIAVGYDDGTYVDPDTGDQGADSMGCGPLINGDEIAGKIALIHRGICNFSLKAYNAQVAGAIGVMIVNVDGAGLGGMLAGDSGNALVIPSWLIDDIDAVTSWRSEIDAGVMEAFFGNKFGLFPDDVGIASNDVFHAEQYSTPRALAQSATEFSVKLGAAIINYGSADQSDVTLNATIMLDGNEIYNETSETPVSVASGDTSFFELPDFSQDTYASGLYELTYTSIIPAEDGFPSDNAYSADFMVSDSIFSYGTVKPDGEPNNAIYFSGDNIPSGTEASYCIQFTDPHASRMIVEGLTFSASAGSELDPDGLIGVIVDVQVYEWEDEFADANDPGFGIAADGSSLNQLTAGEYEYLENLENQNIYVPFADVLALEDDLRYLFCMTYTQENIFAGHDSRTMDYTRNFETYLQPINVQQGENDAGWSTFGVDSSFSLIPAITVRMRDPLYDAINEEVKRVEITPFPNPTANEINIPVGANYGQTLIEVYDITGKKVKSVNLTTTKFEIIKFNVSDLDNGAYIFKMNFEDGSFSNFNVVVNN